MAQLEHIEAIEKRLWGAADTLRANSNYASNEYFLPVMGLIFLRHAYSRFLAVKDKIEATLPKRGGKTRALTKEDFSQKSAIFLRLEAQFDYLVALPDSEDRAKAIIGAMESIEEDYENLRGVLPKSDYQELDNDVLGSLLRTLNPDELKVKNDPRLPFGLPGVNKKDKVSNGNYVWISYFYSYLNEKGRAGFVMSSQASSAGRDEAKVRQKLVETGDVDVMIAIRSNFFYTRTVPCELWFLNRDKPKPHRDKVLMLDARNVYRKVTRKIYDFSPEQEQNLLAIVWLYRGQVERFLGLVSKYLGQVVDEGQACFEWQGEDGETIHALPDYVESLTALHGQLAPFLDTLPKKGPHAETLAEFEKERNLLTEDVDRFRANVGQAAKQWEKTPDTSAGLNKLVTQLAPLAESSRDLIKQADLLYKLATRLIEICETESGAKDSDEWSGKDIVRARKAADESRQTAVEQLKQVRYFWKQAQWLTERFPDGRLRDVEGLVKLVDLAEIEANDWTLTPGRYVGVAPQEVDEDFDFEEALREIHVELEDLNAEAVRLAKTIKKNFEELGI